MTNERAVEILNLDLDILGQYGGETAEAYKMAIQALEAQPSEDCISRQAVLDTIGNVPDHNDGMVFEALSHAQRDVALLPSVTPRRDLAETSQDCISREEVQDLISRWLSDYLLDETREALETINYKVGDMPPVKPKRPKGKWIYKNDNIAIPTGYYQCSECGEGKLLVKDNFCPNCGAEMDGGADE